MKDKNYTGVVFALRNTCRFPKNLQKRFAYGIDIRNNYQLFDLSNEEVCLLENVELEIYSNAGWSFKHR